MLNNIVEFEQQPSDRNKQSHRKMQLIKRFRSNEKERFLWNLAIFLLSFPFFFFFLLYFTSFYNDRFAPCFRIHFFTMAKPLSNAAFELG